MIAKFWLRPVRLEASGGFSRVEIGKVQRLVEASSGFIMRAWDEFLAG
jgi:hypothetical protein